MTETPGLAAAADELYAGDPAAFVARRDELAKQARAAKNRELAAALKKLRRPTVGAWYVNVAVRDGLTSLRELLRVGRELREAQAALDFRRVVDLGPRRADVERRVLADLTAHLARLGITATPAALEEVRSTLRAALTDADAAAAVESGRLDRPLDYGGNPFAGLTLPAPATDAEEAEPHPEPAVDPEPEPAAPSEAGPPAETGPEPEPGPPTEQGADDDGDESAELAELERQAARAEAELAALRERQGRLRAKQQLAAARERVTAASGRVAEAQERHDRLAAELGEAAAALADAEDDLARLRAELERLERSVE